MNILNSLIEYLRSSKNELGKITWPSKDQTIRYSALVIGASVVAAALFGAMDMGLSQLVSAALANKSFQEVPQQTAPPVQPTTVDLNNVQVDSKPVDQTAQPTVDFKNVEPIQTPDANGQNGSTPNF